MNAGRDKPRLPTEDELRALGRDPRVAAFLAGAPLG